MRHPSLFAKSTAPTSTTPSVTSRNGPSITEVTHKGAKSYVYAGATPNPYVQEHSDLIASIRAGEPLNEGEQVAISTLTAIGGRISAYTGREIKWQWLIEGSKLDIFPKECRPGPGIFTPVPIPGKTELI